MSTQTPIEPLIARCRPGWSLPGEFYSDGEIYRHDLACVWRSGWLFAGHSCEVPRAVDYVVNATWKLVWENNRECYHCNVNHPQYSKANFDHYNADDTPPRIRDAISAVVLRSEQKWTAADLAPTHKQTGMTVFPDAE